jgi:ABC-2 type transport system permease protein
VLDLSPFQHTPPLPAASVQLLPLALLSATAIALVAVGLTAFRRRDLVTS